MGYIIFSCGDGVSSFTIKRTYNGTSYTNTDSYNGYMFDEGSTVSLERFSLESGYGYPVYVKNLSTEGVYTYTSASTSKWTFNSNYGSVSENGYEISATPTGPVQQTYYLRLYFDANGGSGAPSAVTGQNTGYDEYVTVTIPYTEPTREGYTFVGWATNTSGTGTIRYPGGTYTGYGNTSSYANHYLYAVWQKASYSVTVVYNANGGSGAPSKHTATGNTEAIEVTLSSVEPTRSGYIFAGWATSSTATTAAYYAGQTLHNVYGTASGYEWNLYAVWTKELIGIVHIGNGSGFDGSAAYIWSNGWKKATPCVWDGSSWKKGV